MVIIKAHLNSLRTHPCSTLFLFTNLLEGRRERSGYGRLEVRGRGRGRRRRRIEEENEKQDGIWKSLGVPLEGFSNVPLKELGVLISRNLKRASPSLIKLGLDQG